MRRLAPWNAFVDSSSTKRWRRTCYADQTWELSSSRVTRRYRGWVAFVPPNLPSPAGRLAEAGTRMDDGDGPQSSEAQRTPTFHVDVTWIPSASHGQRSHGRGKLLITPGAIVFYPSDATRKLIGAGYLEDTERSVTMTTVLMRPPWSNTFLLLQDKTLLVRGGASLFARHKLRRALQQSGVTVQEEKSWRPPHLSPGSRPAASRS
jgi:hypothetical protein